MSNRILFEASGLPVLQNTTFVTREAALQSERGNMCLVEDGKTGLVRNAAFDASKIIYDENYQNEQACSAGFQRHLDEVQSLIGRHFAGKSLIEIGCGKGVFLRRLREAGWNVIGVDPAYEGRDETVIKAFFEPTLGINADAFVLRHVLEHIEDPVAFLHSIAEANGRKGLIYIEVPCFDWICAHRAWFDVFYEHVNYFRLSDFRRLFGKVLQSGRIFGEQYLFVVADLATLRPLVRQDAEPLSFPQDFLATRDRYRNLPVASRTIWGAASKGVIFGIHMQQLGTNIDCAIDINPVKQGRYLPCSGLRVFSPQEALAQLPEASEIFVMNSNYLEEIRAMSGNRHRYIAIDMV